jgi:hypothetical protein
MDNEFGLLWIPIGFLVIFISVAALFLTVLPVAYRVMSIR